ncbi:hypothetical protein KRR38_30595 [Novosphingobium sp. G106]|uniref:hypothetical protein n=1 Tax=Novosphingobium sp. G106 TaxID=2849500 RepID=UPI001C2DA6AF|nr:hypothetical protein [Novosphingobium sp. G106]MBV1691898.1 hypothetical protein [Novosphingobium sp. G106]
MVWIETGGPEVAMPTRSGFGSKLFKMLEKRLDRGSLNLDFRPAGLIASIDFDLPGRQD